MYNMDFEQIKNSTLEVDRIMETVYDDMESGIKEDLIKWGKNFNRSEIVGIYIHMSTIFLNYVFNRLNEFKDPEKAGKKANLAREIILELIDGNVTGSKDC